ncbi:hypothetical protein B9T12_04635 [Wohlfahrtiimonas chitiniclastica]|uniref:hypothetical protein n=1 Tax=Wohlfahrtiimonas chitiniclastica TaxID=400946 RepID=UPI000B982A75|nr:hypothetical protein [Wohlfahrtiimonas chitiniclastica]OYQ79065.1 hypothetical protein B9T12_04635 [Wohlfahrtiimonas chitiniclastica]
MATNLDYIWLYLFNGNRLSDRQAMVQFAYGAFRSRVSEKRYEYHIQDEFVTIHPQGSVVRYKEYWICPKFLRTKRAQRIREELMKKTHGRRA